MRAGLSRDELRIDLDLFARASHAAFEHVAHAEFTPDRFRVNLPAFECKRGVAGDNEAIGNVRKISRKIVGDPIGEILLLGVAAQVLERQNNDREPRRVWRACQSTERPGNAARSPHAKRMRPRREDESKRSASAGQRAQTAARLASLAALPRFCRSVTAKRALSAPESDLNDRRAQARRCS